MNSLLITLFILSTNPTPSFNTLVDQAIQDITLATPVPQESQSNLYNALGWGVHISKWGDFISTEMVLSSGGYELNPLMKSRGTRIAASVAGPALINWVSNEIRPEHPKIAILVRLGAIVANGYLIQHNLRVASVLK